MGHDRFSTYEATHTYRITLLVAPLMITEAVFTTSAFIQPARTLVYLHFSDLDIYAKAAFLRMLLLLLIWVRLGLRCFWLAAMHTH